MGEAQKGRCEVPKPIRLEKPCWQCGKPVAINFDTYVNERKMEREEDYRFAEDVLRERANRKGIVVEKGDELKTNFYARRMFCDKCFEKREKELSVRREKYSKLKKSLMLERAVRLLEGQEIDIYSVKDIIDQMEEYVVTTPEKFDSADEMIAAIILVDNGIKSHMQYKIGNYRVDFLIPSEKIALEIDGERHMTKAFQDNQRDIDIRNELGPDWEVVRIGTEYVEHNAKMLIEAMRAIKKEKQKLRKMHNGMLPGWYSKRNGATKRQVLKSVSDDTLYKI